MGNNSLLIGLSTRITQWERKNYQLGDKLT
jgi:hypothetical protein